MLKFIEIISCFAVSPVLILWFLLRPFIDRFEKLRICIIIVTVSIVSVLNKCLSRYLGEELHNKSAFEPTYSLQMKKSIYLALQIAITSLWTIICTRWAIHSLYLKRPNPKFFCFVRYSGIFVWTLLATYCFTFKNRERNRLSYHLLVIACIWYMAGHYITRRATSITISILIPTAYFYYIDHLLWRTSRNSSSNLFLFGGHLQCDRFFQHLLFNGVIVFTSAALDKSRAVLDIFYPREQLQLRWYPSVLDSITANCKRLLKGLISKEIDFPSYIIEDLENHFKTLNNTSNTFKIGFRLLSSGIAQDTLILYSFCRVIDAVIDSEKSRKSKIKFLTVIKKFLNEIYREYRTDKDLLWHFKATNLNKSKKHINWKYFESKLTHEQLSACRNFSQIAWYLPRKPFDQIMQGFQMDIEGTPLRNEDDLLSYAKLVSKTSFTLWVILVYHKSGEWPDNFGPISKYFIEHLGNLGLVVHIFDAGKDIVVDGKYGCCCVPFNYFPGGEYKFITEERNASKIGDKLLIECVKKLTTLHKVFVNESVLTSDIVPRVFQRGVLGILSVFRMEADTKVATGIYKNHLGTFYKVLIILKCLYLPNYSNLLENRCKKS